MVKPSGAHAPHVDAARVCVRVQRIYVNIMCQFNNRTDVSERGKKDEIDLSRIRHGISVYSILRDDLL
jgi:hypothetical protein